jgi:hypothetical protein
MCAFAGITFFFMNRSVFKQKMNKSFRTTEIWQSSTSMIHFIWVFIVSISEIVTFRMQID